MLTCFQIRRSQIEQDKAQSAVSRGLHVISQVPHGSDVRFKSLVPSLELDQRGLEIGHGAVNNHAAIEPIAGRA